ncbi:MAG: histidine phosphatase family protein [Bacilli bacterium]|nr:histidine phosphatase family protein [Bacilli bacterium]
MLIYIIRHGETDGNKRGILQGCLDIPLNEKGRDLAKVTGQGLKGVKFDVLFASPLSRAKETGEIILRETGSNAEIVIDDRIKELNFGEWEGENIENSKIMSKKDFAMITIDPFHFRSGKSGESMEELLARTKSFFEDLLNNKALQDKTVLVATHGVAYRALLQNAYEDKSDFWHGKVPDNCSVSVLRYDAGKLEILSHDVIYYDASLAYNPYQ